MWYLNIGLHKISLGSLIIALGLLVDDAIIAVEMMVRKLEEGYDKLRLAVQAREQQRRQPDQLAGRFEVGRIGGVARGQAFAGLGRLRHHQ